MASRPFTRARNSRDRYGRRRRLATSFVFAALFSAGAAFSATAGDVAVRMVDSTGELVLPTTTGEQGAAPPAEIPPDDEAGGAGSEPVPLPEPLPPATGEPGDGAPEEAPPSDAAPPNMASDPREAVAPPPAAAPPAATPEPGKRRPDADPPAPQAGSRGSATPEKKQRGSAGAPALAPVPGAARTPLDPETVAAGSAATVWLHRTLPDPTPPAKRLDPSFARALRGAARAERVRWSLVLGVLRAQGHVGRAPATSVELRILAGRLADAGGRTEPWRAALVLGGSVSFADQAVALSRYNAAVGLRALTQGLAAAKPRLERTVLSDPRIDIYPGGRADVAAGRIDVRVLVLLRYLRVAHGQVTVSSLQSGHGFWARPGFVSAHVYGLAVDISMIGGQPILGNQQPLGVTERAVRDILLLPAEVQPQQVISLLGLGGPSFPLADHDDHIHVGF